MDVLVHLHTDAFGHLYKLCTSTGLSIVLNFELFTCCVIAGRSYVPLDHVPFEMVDELDLPERATSHQRVIHLKDMSVDLLMHIDTI